MKVEVEVEIPEGFEATGEVRFPRTGDWYLESTGEASLVLQEGEGFPRNGCFLILRRKEARMEGFRRDLAAGVRVGVGMGGQLMVNQGDRPAVVHPNDIPEFVQAVRDAAAHVALVNSQENT